MDELGTYLRSILFQAWDNHDGDIIFQAQEKATIV